MTMKLSCLQENLKIGLDTVGRAIANRSALPITQSVLMRTEEGMLTLYGTNLEMAIKTRIGAMIEEEGATAVPYQLLNNLVGSLASDRVDLDLSCQDEENPDPTMNDNMLYIRCSRSVTRINVADPTGFPPATAVPDEVAIRLDPALLRAAIGMVAPSAATDESRPVLTAIHLNLDGDKLEMAAADGFRLAVYQCEVEAQHEEPIAINIPARTMTEVQRLSGRQTAPILITMARSNPDNIRFELESATLVSQLVQGNFPNYHQLVPDKYQTRVVVDTEEFRRAVQTASVFAKDGSNIVRIELERNPDEVTATMTVSSLSESIGSQQDECPIAELEGDNNKIAFNYQYLQQLIRVVGNDEKLAMEITDSSAPGVFRIEESDRFLQVVMPMHVQW